MSTEAATTPVVARTIRVFYVAQWIVPVLLLWLQTSLAGSHGRVATQSFVTDLPFVLLGPLLTLVTREGVLRKSVPTGYAVASVIGWVVSLAATLALWSEAWSTNRPAPGAPLADLITIIAPMVAIWFLIAHVQSSPGGRGGFPRGIFLFQWVLGGGYIFAMAFLASVSSRIAQVHPSTTAWVILGTVAAGVPLLVGPLMTVVSGPLRASRRLPVAYLCGVVATVVFLVLEACELARLGRPLAIHWATWNMRSPALALDSRLALLAAIISIVILVSHARHQVRVEAAGQPAPPVVSAPAAAPARSRAWVLWGGWIMVVLAPLVFIARCLIFDHPQNMGPDLLYILPPLLGGLLLGPLIARRRFLRRGLPLPPGYVALTPILWVLVLITVALPPPASPAGRLPSLPRALVDLPPAIALASRLLLTLVILLWLVSIFLLAAPARGAAVLLPPVPADPATEPTPAPGVTETGAAETGATGAGTTGPGATGAGATRPGPPDGDSPAGPPASA